jgi:hypothetical protein
MLRKMPGAAFLHLVQPGTAPPTWSPSRSDFMAHFAVRFSDHGWPGFTAALEGQGSA